MKRTGVPLYQLLFPLIVVSVLFLALSIFPVKASADTLSSQTQQVLPPGANTCSQVSVSDFTPYIYNGSLDSFEFTINDNSYVALLGSVGNTPVPFRLMTRQATDVSGGVRIHVDIASTPVNTALPLTVTLLSARTGQPVCMVTVSMSVGSGSITTTPTAPSLATTTPAPSMNANPTPSTPATSVIPGQGMSTGTASMTPAVTTGITQSPLKNICSSLANAYRLWLILLVLYALIVGGLLWIEFPLSWSWAQTPERVATTILILLLLLLGFWYFSIACRAALWMPLVAFLIAILGLLAAFWNHPRVTQLLLIEEKSSRIVTPPPPAKPVIITPPAIVKSTTTTTTATSTKK